MSGRIRVALVEDNGGLRASLLAVLEAAEDVECAGAWATAEEALEALPASGAEVVLMDINLPGISGVEAVRRLKPAMPELNVIMLTVYDDSERIFGALQAGATGYLLKRTPADELLEAIREVRGGGAPMSSHIARQVVASFRRPAPAELAAEAGLSGREEEVLRRVARGLVNKEIADELGIATETVRQHLKNIYGKLHVRSRTEAAMTVFGREKGNDPDGGWKGAGGGA